MACRSKVTHGLEKFSQERPLALIANVRWRDPLSTAERKSQRERDRHQERAARVKSVLDAAGLPVKPSETPIVPAPIIAYAGGVPR